MATCEVCGNDYDKAFSITQADGTTGTFDSFECAIHQVAPRCAHCGCAIIGHGEEAAGEMYSATTAPGTPPVQPPRIESRYERWPTGAQPGPSLPDFLVV